MPARSLLLTSEVQRRSPLAAAHGMGHVLHAPARALLQANQAPPVGGFQAARYFTYVFFGELVPCSVTWRR